MHGYTNKRAEAAVASQAMNRCSLARAIRPLTRKKTDRDGRKAKTSGAKPEIIDVTDQEQPAIFASIPNEIQAGDFDEEWWPKLKGFPLNILHLSPRTSQNGPFLMSAALYTPELQTFCAKTTRSAN